MAKERLWAQGNREPSDFVRAFEVARRAAAEHREPSHQAWQEYATLMKLLPEAVGRLLVLEDEREAFTRRLTVDAAPLDASPDKIDPLCQDALAGALAHLSHDASRKGWPTEAAYRAMIAYGEYMLAFTRNAMGIGHTMEGLSPQEKATALEKAKADGYGSLPPYGTGSSRQVPSDEI